MSVQLLQVLKLHLAVDADKACTSDVPLDVHLDVLLTKHAFVTVRAIVRIHAKVLVFMVAQASLRAERLAA